MKIMDTTKALLVIDMQKGFLDRDFCGVDKLVTNIEKLYTIKPVVLVEYMSGLNEDVTIDKLNKSPNKFYKMDPSAFQNNGQYNGDYVSFEKALKKQGIENLIVSGINTSLCVKATIHDAVEKGFSVYTSLDVIADNLEMNKKNHTRLVNSLNYIKSIATVYSSVDELITKLS